MILRKSRAILAVLGRRAAKPILALTRFLGRHRGWVMTYVICALGAVTIASFISPEHCRAEIGIGAVIALSWLAGTTFFMGLYLSIKDGLDRIFIEICQGVKRSTIGFLNRQLESLKQEVHQEEKRISEKTNSARQAKAGELSLPEGNGGAVSLAEKISP